MSEQPQLRWLDDYCHYCGNQLNSWDVRVCKALGYLKYHVCEKCITKEYDAVEVEEFRGRMERYLGMRPCIGI